MNNFFAKIYFLVCFRIIAKTNFFKENKFWLIGKTYDNYDMLTWSSRFSRSKISFSLFFSYSLIFYFLFIIIFFLFFFFFIFSSSDSSPPSIIFFFFLDASTHLYKRLCPSVDPSVRGDRVWKRENAHFRPCPSIRNWYWPCIRPCLSAVWPLC